MKLARKGKHESAWVTNVISKVRPDDRHELRERYSTKLQNLLHLAERGMGKCLSL